MSKAVLIMDMPERCEDCIYSGSDGDICCLTNQDIPEETYLNGRLNECPLRELPEEFIEDKHNADYVSGWNEGWNAYRDKLLGE